MSSSSQPEHHPASYIPSVSRMIWVVLALAILDLSALLLDMRIWAQGGVTMLWPSNGFLLGVILCAPRRQWPAYLTLGFAVDIGINILLTYNGSTSAYLAGCNMVEVGLAGMLMYRAVSPNPDFTRRKQLISLLLFGVIVSPAITSALAQLNTTHAEFLPLFTSFKQWFTADALGIALVTPLYVSFNRAKPFSGRSWLEVAALFVFLVASTVLVFSQSEFPILFLITPSLLLLGVRLGLGGSATGLLIVSIVGGYFTTEGRGPLKLIADPSLTTKCLVLQIFVAVSMLILYIIEVVTTEGRYHESNLRASETRFRVLAEASNDMIVLADLNGNRRYVSPAAATVIGWQPEELVGGDFRQIAHPDDMPRLDHIIQRFRTGLSAEAIEYRCKTKDGGFIWLEASMRLYRDPGTGDPSGIVSVIRDISSRKATEEERNRAYLRAENQARLDGLTGLANRRALDERLDGEWRRAMRDHSHLSLLLIDVDHFKPFNDIYGHLAGDTCLRTIASTAQHIIHRSSDLLARFGGEEFVVVLPHTDSNGAHLVAEQIRSAVEQHAISHIGNPHNIVTVSIGCATQRPTHDTSPTDILHEADAALYRAKSAGRNRVETTTAQES